MTAIVQVEFRARLLSMRDDILQSLGHPVISALDVVLRETSIPRMKQ